MNFQGSQKHKPIRFIIKLRNLQRNSENFAYQNPRALYQQPQFSLKKIKFNEDHMEEQCETEQESFSLSELDLGLQTFTFSLNEDKKYVCVNIKQRKDNQVDNKIFQAHYGQMENQQRWLIPIAFFKGCFSKLKYERDDIFEKDNSLMEFMKLYKNKMIGKQFNHEPQIQAFSIKKDLYQQLQRDQKFCILQGIQNQGRILIVDSDGFAKMLSSLLLSNIYNFAWPLLIICNKKQKLQWARQVQDLFKIPSNQIQIIDGFQNQLQNVQVTIISYKLCSTFEQALIQRRYQICLIDGCEKLLKKELQCTISCNQIIHKCQFKLLLTGKETLNSYEQQDLMINYGLNGFYQFPQISQQNHRIIRIKEQLPYNEGLKGILGYVNNQLEEYKKFAFLVIDREVILALKELARRKNTRCVIIDSTQTAQQNQQKLDEFLSDKSIKIAIISYKVVNQKLNLKASEIVFGQILSNLYGMIKMESLIKPINQNESVTYHYLIDGSNDDKIYQEIFDISDKTSGMKDNNQIINHQIRQEQNQNINNFIDKIIDKARKNNQSSISSKYERKQDKSYQKKNQTLLKQSNML